MGNVVNRVFDSAGPEGKVRGTPQQIIEKYTQLARDAQLSGDRVAAENFQQHSEHYLRMLDEAMREQAAKQAEQQRQQDAQQQERRQQGNANGHGGQDQNSGSEDRSDQPDTEGRSDARSDSRPEPRPRRNTERNSSDRAAERGKDRSDDRSEDRSEPAGFAAVDLNGDQPDTETHLVDTPEAAAEAEQPPAASKPKPRAPRTRRPRTSAKAKTEDGGEASPAAEAAEPPIQ